MDILKKHIGAIIFSVVVAIIGVACSIVPYFAVASIVTQLINGATDYRIFLPYAGPIFAGFAMEQQMQRVPLTQAQKGRIEKSIG